MTSYSRSQFSNPALLSNVTRHLGVDRQNTAELLADLGEVDERHLYRDAGYASMHAWCTGCLHLSCDSASKRIYAARAARKFPALFHAVADGRLHLSAVVILASALTADSVDALIAAATHKTKEEIAVLLATRAP